MSFYCRILGTLTIAATFTLCGLAAESSITAAVPIGGSDLGANFASATGNGTDTIAWD